MINQRKPRAYRDKKYLAKTRDNHIRLCNMRLGIIENRSKPSENRTLLLSKCLRIPVTGWLFNLTRYPSKWNKENDRNMRETKWNSASNMPREKTHSKHMLKHTYHWKPKGHMTTCTCTGSKCTYHKYTLNFVPHICYNLRPFAIRYNTMT